MQCGRNSPTEKSEPFLADPAVRLWITEGIKKGDALTSQGCCALALQGVDSWQRKNVDGQSEPLADWQAVVLKGRHVAIVYDSDVMIKKEVAGALRRLTKFLRARHALPVHVVWPGALHQQKVGVDDFFAAGHTLAELEALLSASAAPPPAVGSPTAAAPRPVIYLSPEMTRVVDEAQAALLTLPDAPVLFQRGHGLCTIARGVPPPKWLSRSPEAPIIQALKPAWLMELMSRAADWLKRDKRAKQGEEWQPALPPHWAVEALHARPGWLFPALTGLISTPTFRPDGTLLATPGYDQDTGLFLDTQGVTFPPLLVHPTKDDAAAAVATFRDLLQDFPFVGASFAAALAAILTLLCRFTVQGNVPLFPVRSTVRASGKGLLIDVLSTIGTGRNAPHWPQSDNDEEDRKRMVTVGLAGDACIHIDNVKYPLGSPALDVALTTSEMSDRLLGVNQKVTVPLTLVWFASGNNMQFKGDTVRRVVPIDLDPAMERPEERTAFAYPDLLPHVRAHRPALAIAALTIVQAYGVAGCPPQGLSAYGSFQEWSDLIRSAVVWATGADPCEGRKDLEAQSDPAFDKIATLLTCWEACYGDAFVSVGTAADTIAKEMEREETRERTTKPEEYTPNPEVQKWSDLQQALSNFDSSWHGKGKLNSKAIGSTFPAIRGRVIGDKRFERSPTRHNDGYRWRVSCVSCVSSRNPRAENGIEEHQTTEREKTNTGIGWPEDTQDTQDTRSAEPRSVEPLPSADLQVGDFVVVSVNGVEQNRKAPWRITRLEPAPDGQLYVRFPPSDYAGGFPLGDCEKVDAPAPLVSPAGACAVCGRVERWDDHGTLRCQECWPQPVTHGV